MNFFGRKHLTVCLRGNCHGVSLTIGGDYCFRLSAHEVDLL